MHRVVPAPLTLAELLEEAATGSDREALRAATSPTQASLGWTFPEAVMQHAVPALERVTVDVAELEAERDLLVGAFGGWGYDVLRPEGTFYLWGAAPGGDAVFGIPAHVRLCLTATRDMVGRALSVFEEAARGALARLTGGGLARPAPAPVCEGFCAPGAQNPSRCGPLRPAPSACTVRATRSTRAATRRGSRRHRS